MFLAFNSPDLGGTDAFIFRDPGCNCAAHRGFVSLSVPNRPAAIPPELFADYTPGAPLLFAPAARIFGCRPYTDSYYNLFLLTLIAFFVVWVLPGDSEQRGQRTFAALLAGITLPVGLFLTGVDRPEPLALAFFFALLLLWKKVRNNWAKSLAAGLAGSLFLIHPYVGIVSYMLFLLLLMCSPGATGRLKIFLCFLGHRCDECTDVGVDPASCRFQRDSPLYGARLWRPQWSWSGADSRFGGGDTQRFA